jgi:hypothetical protein
MVDELYVHNASNVDFPSFLSTSKWLGDNWCDTRMDVFIDWAFEQNPILETSINPLFTLGILWLHLFGQQV